MIDTTHTALPAGRPQTQRPAMSPGLVLLRALLASGVAILAGLTLTYLVRVTLNLNAFQDTGSVGFPNSGALSAGICITTLLAVVVLELLLRVTPHAFGALAAIMALGYLAFLGVSVTGNLTASQITGQLLVGIPLAMVITVLAAWAVGVLPEMP